METSSDKQGDVTVAESGPADSVENGSITDNRSIAGTSTGVKRKSETTLSLSPISYKAAVHAPPAIMPSSESSALQMCTKFLLNNEPFQCEEAPITNEAPTTSRPWGLSDETKNIQSSDETFNFFHISEIRHGKADARYMNRQRFFNHMQRSQLVDWLVYVCRDLKLTTKTLCLTVNYIDRFLSRCTLPPRTFKTYAIVALFLAAKFEEDDVPNLFSILYATKYEYLSKKRIEIVEAQMLRALDYNMWLKTTVDFVHLYCERANDMIPKGVFLAMYIAELTLIDGEQFLKYNGSKIAAGAIAVARYTLHMPLWSTQLEMGSKYCLDFLKDIILALSRLHHTVPFSCYKGIMLKYREEEFMKVARMPPQRLITRKVFHNALASYDMIRFSKNMQFYPNKLPMSSEPQ